MSGQKPKVNTIFFPLPVITNANIDDCYDPSMTVQSTCFANGKDRHLVANDYFDQFFSGGEKAPALTPLVRGCFGFGRPRGGRSDDNLLQKIRN